MPTNFNQVIHYDLWSSTIYTLFTGVADDIVLIRTRVEKLDVMAQGIFLASARKGLKTISKTKYMTNNPASQLKVNNVDTEKMDEYLYLGQIISFSNGIETEISSRTEQAWKSSWALREYSEAK